MSEQLIDQIRRAHRSARPKPSENPAWANCHYDCGILLSEIERQAGALTRIKKALRELLDDMGEDTGQRH